VSRPSCRGFLCRGWRVRRRLATSCATGYQLAAPSGAWRGCACASTAVAMHPETLWPRSQVSQVCLRMPATACSTWTFHVLVHAVAVCCPCEPAGLQRIWVQGTSPPPRAAPLVTRALLRAGVRGNPRASALVTRSPQRGATARLKASHTARYRTDTSDASTKRAGHGDPRG
jgi:hypothetical protein